MLQWIAEIYKCLFMKPYCFLAETNQYACNISGP